MEWHKLMPLFIFFANVYGVALKVKGLVPSVFTPFDDKGHLNLTVVPDYAKYLEYNGVDGALVAGTASEGPTLNLAERMALLDAWLKAARPLGLKIVMQIGGMPMPDVLEMAKYCEQVQPDALLTLPEMYYKPADVDALVRFVKLISAAAPSLPILYYDHPSLSGVNLNMAKFFDQATRSIPNFKGIKCGFLPAVSIDATNNVTDDQEIFMASHAIRASSCMMGFTSSMSAVSNIFPDLMREIEQAVLDSDIVRAKNLQRDLNRKVAEIVSVGDYVPAVKTAMGIISGLRLGNTRDPLVRITKHQRKLIAEKLNDMNL